MGANTPATRANGTPPNIDATWFNDLLDAIALGMVPRVLATGVPTNSAGNLGTASLSWTRLYAEADFSVGDLKLHHSYNGAAIAGDGWMLCDGRQVNQSNYDAEHGAGTWNSYIGSSSLQDKFLPSFPGRYMAGVAVTTQDGTLPINGIGNPLHAANFTHVHKWYTQTGGSGLNSSFGPTGSARTLVTPSGSGSAGLVFNTSASGIPNNFYLTGDYYTAPAGDMARNVQPDSIEYLVYMKII